MKTGVGLRDIAEDDLLVFFEHQRQPDANQMAAFPARDREGFMSHWRRILADGSIVKKAVLFQGDLAGNIVCFEQADERQVGYWIGQAFWGKGIASEALLQFLEVVQQRPLFAHVAKQNVGSIRVLEKSGFTRIGENPVTDAPGAEPVEELVFKLDSHRSSPEPRNHGGT